MKIQRQFGVRLKELRTAMRMSQQGLALRAGLDKSYISSTERGHRNISLVSIQKICKVLNVTLGEFFAGVNETELN